MDAVTTAAGHALDVLWLGLVFLVGVELGYRRGHRWQKDDNLSPLQRFVAFWLQGSDGRVNYSRATALSGIVGYFVIVIVALHKYEASEKPDTQLLVVCLVAALAMLGINLGQYGVQQASAVKMAQANNPAPPAPPPDSPPAGASASVTVVQQAPRRDSGTGATQLLEATAPPPGFDASKAQP